MSTSTSMGAKPLAQLCYRLGTSLEAGVDIRKALAREAERGSPTYQRQIASISQHVASGSAVADALSNGERCFPPLFCEMVALGEATGKLDAVLLRLAEHYDGQVRLRRVFLAGITWPMIQLVAAILVIGFLIWILGIIGNTDILGFGMIGTSGAIKYFTLVAFFAIGVALLIRGMMHGWLWTRPVQRLLFKIPALGPSLKTIALSRIAWTMSLTFNSGMDARRAIELALRNAGNTLFSDPIEPVGRRIEEGDTICSALRSTGLFPFEFLDSLEVGEESGRLAESMSVLSDQYRERATAAFHMLTVVGGFVVWGIVAMVIIFFIFRLASFYFGAISGGV